MAAAVRHHSLIHSSFIHSLIHSLTLACFLPLSFFSFTKSTYCESTQFQALFVMLGALQQGARQSPSLLCPPTRGMEADDKHVDTEVR